MDWYVNAYCAYPVGDVSNGVYGVTYSYGSKHRRTRIVPITLGKSTILAASTSTAMAVSTIPTGDISPYTGVSSSVCIVIHSGDVYVDYYVDGSYGI